jgi:subtilisin family serine protease
MREYNIALHKDVDYDGFWNDMETETDGLLYIPNRKIEFTNERPASIRQCWYLLTDEEADIIRQDQRVFCVEIPPEHRDDIKLVRNLQQRSNFSKTTLDTGDYVNWGLLRSNYATNIYGASSVAPLNTYYDYTLDGSGVDVVIQDSGIQVDHPEFQDTLGNSRVQQINWGTVSGLFTQNANHYRDFHGHGTHCAGIAAGKTYGWAKAARIYALKVAGLEGTGDSGTGVSVTYCFDAIKIWHAAKPIEPKTGCRRPTVINMSWGYSQDYSTLTSLTWRGNTYTTGSAINDSFWRFNNAGVVSEIVNPGSSGTYNSNVRVGSVDADIQELIDAGIVVCIAAGNSYQKIDKSTGVEYNNNMVTNTGTIYYHRGSSPYDDQAIIVGSLDSSTYDADRDQKSTFSNTGPGVDIYAPGSNIMSSCSTTNEIGGQNYNLNASYKQANISGTSMASPQVAGMAALLLQMNPTASVAQIKNSMVARAQTNVHTGSVSSSYVEAVAIQGGLPLNAFSNLGGSNNLVFSGSFSISTNINFV